MNRQFKLKVFSVAGLAPTLTGRGRRVGSCIAPAPTRDRERAEGAATAGSLPVPLPVSLNQRAEAAAEGYYTQRMVDFIQLENTRDEGREPHC